MSEKYFKYDMYRKSEQASSMAQIYFFPQKRQTLVYYHRTPYTHTAAFLQRELCVFLPRQQLLLTNVPEQSCALLFSRKKLKKNNILQQIIKKLQDFLLEYLYINPILKKLVDFVLQVPVQRVTKYPLLLSRLHKVTPSHHEDKNNIKLAQDKIEAALEQMNKVRKLSSLLDNPPNYVGSILGPVFLLCDKTFQFSFLLKKLVSKKNIKL